MNLQDHIKNTEAAIEFWATVPENSVSRKLENYREGLYSGGAPSCDSPACFGGWLSFSQYFAALGVVSYASGRPMIRDRILNVAQVSLELFGRDSLFDPRKESSKDGTDHEVVAARLSAQLARLQLGARNETTELFLARKANAV